MELIGQIQNGGSLNGSFGYDSGDYELLSHKPQINGVTLIGNKTSADLHIEGGGTDDYNDLDNKPMINGVQLSGNLSPEDLGLAEIIYPDDPTIYLNGAGEFTEPDYFSGNYNDLASKPMINGVVVEGYLNTSDLLIDYDDLSGRPQINGSTLTGNQTAEDLGLEPEINYPGDATKYLNGEGNFTTPDYFSGDYDDLTDKPQINGVTLSGNQSSEDLNIYTPSTIGEEAAAAAINFTTEGAYNLLHCITDYKYSQDLHGYDKPWAPGAGKNLSSVNTGNNVVVAHCNTGQTYTFSIRNQGNCGFNLKKNNSTGDQIARQDASTSSPLYLTFTADEDFDLFLNGFGSGGETFGSSAYDYQLELGSTATEYEPYSNICPIIGVDNITITKSPTSNPAEGVDYNITLDQTQYEGYIDISTGQLIEDYGYIASYAGEVLPGAWVSDRDLYDPENPNTPTTGAEVIYLLTEPSESFRDREIIITYMGSNYMWSNTGDISAVYAIKINDPIIEYLLNR